MSKVDANVVDLRYARAYLPICVLYAEFAVIVLIVLFFKNHDFEVWPSIAIIVWALKRMVPEKVFAYNGLLETVTFSSLVMRYRALQTPQQLMINENILNLLLFKWFVSVNLFLSHKTLQKYRSTLSSTVLWLVTTVLIFCSLHTSNEDSYKDFEMLKSFFFVTASVLWVYVYDNFRLKYDSLHDCEECKLRFMPLLFCPVRLTFGMVFCLVCFFVYSLATKESLTNDKKNDDLESAAVRGSVNSNNDGEDEEIFKLALSQNKL
jgi:hypothetical protein